MCEYPVKASVEKSATFLANWCDDWYMILFRTSKQKELENELESTKQQISTLQSKNNVSDLNLTCMKLLYEDKLDLF